VIVRRRFRFEAAHHLPKHPGKCRTLHGHSYELIVEVDRPVDPASGMVLDFAELKQIVKQEVVAKLDHRCINEIIENPTAEEIARWSWTRLATLLPGLSAIELRETADCSVIYRGS
jgi:6-pyruvoyltetrahydropterin/6-carboxytetrahydropterin synthase